MKRVTSLLLALAVGAVMSSTATAAAEPKPVIEDPDNDANFVNDQGTGDGSFGDRDDLGGQSQFADIVAVAFTSDKKNLYVHLKTLSTSPPAAGEGMRVRTNPGAGGTHCLNFEIFFPGAQNNVAAAEAHLRDACTPGSAPIKVEQTVSPYGAFLLIVPRKGIDALKKGAKLTAPQAQTFLWSGSNYPAGVAGPYLDTTKVGKDYTIKN